MQEIYGSKELWDVASQNCSDMMLRVSWKYNKNYTKEFYPAQNYPTDYGACCVISPFMDFENEENEKGLVMDWLTDYCTVLLDKSQPRGHMSEKEVLWVTKSPIDFIK